MSLVEGLSISGEGLVGGNNQNLLSKQLTFAFRYLGYMIYGRPEYP